MLSETGVEVPQYNQADTLAIKPGLYLCLFHGRQPKEQELQDWGTNGPMIGPLHYVHTTYGSDIKFEFVDRDDIPKYFEDRDTHCIALDDSMLPYGGVWYGDWTVANFN